MAVAAIPKQDREPLCIQLVSLVRFTHPPFGFTSIDEMRLVAGLLNLVYQPIPMSA
jgi:hypothetical protein